MKRLKAGPELKMPELKVPDVLVDLYWDLRDRRLLPLVALVLVAIVAVPFLLGGSKDESGSSQGPALAAPSPEPAGSKLTVVEAKPGLREPGKRLRYATPTDPFVQRYSGPMLAGTKLGGGGGGGGEASKTSSTTTSSSTTTVTKTSGSGTTKVTTETSKSGSSPGGKGSPAESSPGGSTASPEHLTLYAFAIDVKIVRTATAADGGKDHSEPEVKHRVTPPMALPDEKTQVVTYMGVSPQRRPMLLISDSVTSVFGEAKCLSGTNACQLIEVEPGMPMTFVYGPDSVRYKITVLKVEPVVAGQE